MPSTLLMRLLAGATVLAALASASVPGMVNPGTPDGVPSSYDCAVRKQAWEFGKATLPARGTFRTLFDALQLQWCNLTAPSEMDAWQPPTYPAPGGAGPTVYADATASAGGDGSIAKPYSTLAAAVGAVAGKLGASILLRKGTFHVPSQIVLTSAHSGLTIQNYNGEDVTISGGVPLPLTGWKKLSNQSNSTGWQVFPNSNNVFGKAHSHTDTADIKYLGSFQTIAECEKAAESSPKGPFHSFTWHSPQFHGEFSTQCFGTVSASWSPSSENNIFSGRHAIPQNVWAVDLSALGLDHILGIRIDDARAIRAKYPNGNPELTGPDAVNVLTYQSGWITAKTDWVTPADKWSETKDIVSNQNDWPGVNWPTVEEGGGGQEGEGDWGDYHIGYGGFCDDIFPPTGYWCSQKPPRGNCYDPTKRTSRGCTQTHMSPDGVHFADVLPQAANYSNPAGAVIQAWRGMARWFTNLCLVQSVDAASQTLVFDDKIGCNQGGEGNTQFSQWWIENVFEELDAPGEWFYSESEKKLYFFFNGTSTPADVQSLVATRTKVLFNITGTKTALASKIRIRGVRIRDTAYTYLGTDPADIHGMPSGGDWALQRSGAVLMENTELCEVDGCLFTRIDGNGIFLSNLNLNATISNNEMAYVGDSAIAAWGSTTTCFNANCSRSLPWEVGPDARAPNQPRYTHIVGNLVREIGIWQKQSSMWFQAIAAHTHLERNVHFNGPRAGFNFNDQAYGGDIIEGNLLANCVRESGDHGPWNSWDRTPYIVDSGLVRDTSLPPIGPGHPGHQLSTKPSVVPQFREIRHNLIIGTYNSQEAIDTDDGSSYYQTHDNLFAFADHGLKSDFGGQWNHHWNNVYGYVGSCFGTGNNLAFYNNSCVTKGKGFGCPKNPTMTVQGNRVFTSDGQGSACKGSVAQFPSDADLVAMGAAVLRPFPLPSTVQPTP